MCLLRILLIHSDYLEFQPKKKAIESAEEIKSMEPQHIDDCLVVFTAVEKGDSRDEAALIENAVSEIKKVAQQVNAEKIVIYPFAHISSDLSSPDVALRILKELEKALKAEKFEVHRAMFGWYKSFTVSCKGHPLSELSRHIQPKKISPKVEEVEEFLILTPDGKTYDPKEYKFTKKDKDFERLVAKEVFKEPFEVKGTPKYQEYLKKFGIEWEPLSDAGHMRYGPEGTIIFDLIGEYAWTVVKKSGIPTMMVKGTNMFDLSAPPVRTHAELFGDRLYKVSVDEKDFVMRYAACHQQFAMVKDWIISYKNLPFGAFEVADSYRLEQKGELMLSFRTRKLHMPDFHVFTKDVKDSQKVTLKLHEIILNEAKNLGREYVSLYNLTKSYFEKEKDYIMSLVKKEGKPVLLHFVPENKFYWVINIEYCIVDTMRRPREIGTFQIDIGNAKRFEITYRDENDQKQYPPIIHTALIGTIERYLYTVLDSIVMMEKQGKKPMFPVWLSPIQVRIIPMGANLLDKANEIADKIEQAGFRVDIDDRDEKLSYRMREAETKWVPYIVVLGEQEVKSGTLSVRIRANKENVKITEEDLIKRLIDDTQGYPKRELTIPRLLSQRPGYR